MRRGRVFMYLALILVLLLVGGYLLYQNFLQPSGTAEETAEEAVVIDTVDVVVITQRADRGTVLDETVLGLIPVPRELVIDAMFTNLGEAVGRQAKFDLDSGIPLTENMLVDSAAQLSEAGSIAALSIPEGLVAKSIPITRLASVSYALRPGDRVVVIASMQFIDIDPDFQTVLPNEVGVLYGAEGAAGEQASVDKLTSEVEGLGAPLGKVVETDDFPGQFFYVLPSQRQRPRLAAQAIIPSATILKVGDFEYEEEEAQPDVPPTPTPVPAGPDEAPPPVEESKPPDNVTLIVTPQEAVTLTYLLDSGVDLTLALRSAGDSTVIDTSTTTMQFFLDEYAIPIPQKLPFGWAPQYRFTEGDLRQGGDGGEAGP